MKKYALIMYINFFFFFFYKQIRTGHTFVQLAKSSHEYNNLQCVLECANEITQYA